MAGSTLHSIHSFEFPQVLDGAINRLIDLSAAVQARHVPQLGPCWFDDGEFVCKHAATVHLLGSDWSFCERHFKQVTK